ncbi:hypothetical protein NPX13_g5625 [Xylaria arbuscula]|uniref:Uncharacterized protein n=1 Tax=Xylaria arbuscula TaxID=114810 RepID=A0A9W8TL49_9PEZI|nr:hypothetical protein NPX13_g5625 [Xylaria arbuscula]
MTPTPIPTAPRQMLLDLAEKNESSMFHADAVFDKASSDLFPKLVLLRALTSFNSEYRERQHSENKSVNTCRDFLNSFAYICDFKRGGSTVTAAALQRLSGSHILWLAANEGISKHVEAYAEQLRRLLVEINTTNLSDLRNALFSLAVEKCGPRIKSYRDKVQDLAKRCKSHLAKGPSTPGGKHAHASRSPFFFILSMCLPWTIN